jgi:nucleoid-associated protein YgaU
MDYEYEHDDYAPRVLWGRVAFFLIALLLVFLFGRCTAGGADPDQLAQREREVMELTSENTDLRNQLQAVQATQNQGGQDTGDGGDTEEEPTEDTGTAEEDATESEGQDAVDAEGETYVVQEGDTLVTIARQFYGEGEKYTLIVEANNLEGTNISVGQELIIPPEE